MSNTRNDYPRFSVTSQPTKHVPYPAGGVGSKLCVLSVYSSTHTRREEGRAAVGGAIQQGLSFRRCGYIVAHAHGPIPHVRLQLLSRALVRQNTVLPQQKSVSLRTIKKTRDYFM